MRSVLALTLVLLAGCAGRAAPAWRADMDAGAAALRAQDHATAAAAFRRAGGLAAADPAGRADAAACQAQLAIALGQGGDAAGAEAAWRAAIDGFAAAHGPDAPEVAACCDPLARLVAGRGGMPEAEALLRRALACRDDGTPAAYRQAMLADAVRAQGRPAEAAPLYRQAIAGWERIPGGDPVNLELTRHGLAQCLPAAEARPLLEQAAAGIGRFPGARAASLPVLDTLASACAELGDRAAAESALRRALAIAGDAEPAAEPALHGRLAALAAADGRSDDAIAELRTAIAGRRRLGGDPAGLAGDLSRLAALEQAAGSPLAVGSWRDAVAAWESCRGPAAAGLAPALFSLADALDGIGRSADAIPPAERALRILAGDGTDRQPYVAALNHVVGLCARARDLDRAIALNDEACRIVERTLGPRDPNLATALRNGAELRRRVGRTADGDALDRRADGIAPGR